MALIRPFFKLSRVSLVPPRTGDGVNRSPCLPAPGKTRIYVGGGGVFLGSGLGFRVSFPTLLPKVLSFAYL